jgi:hypothetical protein
MQQIIFTVAIFISVLSRNVIDRCFFVLSEVSIVVPSLIIYTNYNDTRQTYDLISYCQGKSSMDKILTSVLDLIISTYTTLEPDFVVIDLCGFINVSVLS